MGRANGADRWSQFLSEHRRALSVYALSLTRSHPDAADLIQDVLVRLLRSGRDPDVGLPYVLRCLRNRAADLRSERAAPPTLPPDEAPGCGFLSASPDPEACRQARAALEGLPPAAREVVVLRVYGELTFRDIADLLEQPLGTVTSTYRRALAALREILTPEVDHV